MPRPLSSKPGCDSVRPVFLKERQDHGPRQESRSDRRRPQGARPLFAGGRGQRLVFCAGQIPLDPATGEIVEGGIAEQTHQVLKNLRAVLKAAGSDLGHAVKTTVFLKSMDSFAAMNEVYGLPEYFGSSTPARSTKRSRPPAARRHGGDRSRCPRLDDMASLVT